MKRYRTCHVCGRRRSLKYLKRVGGPMLRWERFKCIKACNPQDGVEKLLEHLGIAKD